MVFFEERNLRKKHVQKALDFSHQDGANKVGHLYCRICIGIEVSNLLRILLSKFISKGSEFTVGFVSNVDRI